MSEAAQWRLEGDAAALSCGPLAGCVDFLAPVFTRFVLKSWRGNPTQSFAVLTTGGPFESLGDLVERYVRGNDLVEQYQFRPPSSGSSLKPLLYWRAANHEDLSAVEVQLMLSLQTDLLDANPASNVRSFAIQTRAFHAARLSRAAFRELPQAPGEAACDGSESSSHLFVFRHDAGLSYAQMVHPTDFVRACVRNDGDGAWTLDTGIFHERLEKGVIRRGRICGWFLPAENDLAIAVELAKRFIDEPPPLTA